MWKQVDKHKAKDAVRLGFQSAIAAAVVYGAMEAFSIPEKFVAVLSAVLVIETSIGSSISNSGDRVLATIVGCLIGIACLYVLPNGYGVIAGLAFSMFIMNGISAFRPNWRYGVVAAVALAINPGENPMSVAFDRTVAIGFGVLVGCVASIVVWPEKSSTRAWHHIRLALGAIADYLNEAVDTSVSDSGDTHFDEFANTYSTHISAARTLAANMNIGDSQKLQNGIDAAEKLKHSVTMIRTISSRTNDLQDGSDNTKEAIDRVKSIFFDAATHLSNAESLSDLPLEELQHKIDELKDDVNDDDNSADKTVERNAFVFALTETKDSLQKLDDV